MLCTDICNCTKCLCRDHNVDGNGFFLKRFCPFFFHLDGFLSDQIGRQKRKIRVIQIFRTCKSNSRRSVSSIENEHLKIRRTHSRQLVPPCYHHRRKRNTRTNRSLNVDMFICASKPMELGVSRGGGKSSRNSERCDWRAEDTRIHIYIYIHYAGALYNIDLSADTRITAFPST